VPLPALVLSISEIAVIGTPINEALFPRGRARRIPASQPFNEETPFGKRAAAHLDFSIDMTQRLELTEMVIGCYAWSSVPTELLVTWVRFANKGVLAYVAGGIDGKLYELVIHIKTTSGRVFQFIAEIEISRDADESLPTYHPPGLFGPDDADDIYLTDVLGVLIVPPLVSATGGWY
jgi:hypothetical protein